MQLKSEDAKTDYAVCDVQKIRKIVDDIFESESPINSAQNHLTLFDPTVLDRQIDHNDPNITVLKYMLKKGRMKAIELLYAQPNLLTEKFFNKEITEGPDAGKTLLWSIVASQEGCYFLSQHQELLRSGNFDAAPIQGLDAGKTVLWLLAASQEGRELLVQHFDLLNRSCLNAAPITGPDVGKTILWLLAASTEGYSFLLQHPELLMERNLNLALTQGPYAGSTVLWWFAVSPDGRQFLLKYPALLNRCNLDAALTAGPEVGKTILWRFIANPEGNQFLSQHPALLSKSNLDAAPTEGPWVGETVLWLLATSPEGCQFLLKHPELLKKHNLNASPILGKTVTYCLVEAGLENEVLGAIESNFIDLSTSYKAKDKQQQITDVTLLETLIKKERFDAIKKLVTLYLDLEKQEELDFLMDKIPSEIGWQVCWLMNLIDAEAYYTDLIVLEDIDEIQPIAEKILKYINDVDSGSYYYKTAQQLKAMVLSYTHKFKCPTSSSLGCAQTSSNGVNNLLEIVNALFNAGRPDEMLLLLSSRLRDEFTENKPEEISQIPSITGNTSNFFKNQSTNGNDNMIPKDGAIINFTSVERNSPK